MALQQLPRRTAAWITIFSCSLLGSTALATTLYDNGLINAINGPSEDIEVSNGPGDVSTTVDVVDGADIGVNVDELSIALRQGSVLNFSGGTAQGDVSVEGNSAAFLLGTAIVGGNLSIVDNGVLQFSDDSLVEGDVELDDDAHADFSGGTVEGEVVAAGNATASFFGGTFEDTIVAEDDAVVTLLLPTAEDNVEAADDAVIHIFGGEIRGSVESADDAMVNVSGGQFPAIFSDGEEMIAEGGTIHVTGGIFGESGVNDGGLVRAAFGGLVHFMGAEIAGADDGTAPVATLSALTNGELNVSDVAFGDLVLEANTGGTVNVGDITAENISVSMLGGGTVNFQAGEADSLEVLAELESFVNLRGGHFGVIDVTLQTNSVLTIFGNSFTFFGTPVELLPEEAFVRETGELRTIGGISALAGALADGMPFSLSYSRQLNPPGTRVFLIRVPEPTALALAVLAAAGLGACRVRGREQS